MTNSRAAAPAGDDERRAAYDRRDSAWRDGQQLEAGGAATAVLLGPELWQIAGQGISHEWDASAYLVGGERPVLIDCGSVRGATAVHANLRATTDQAPADLLLTHGHWDHASGARRLVEELGIEVHIHADDADVIATGDDVRSCAAALYGEQFPAVAPTRLLTDGDVFDTGSATVEVVHTPGHTPGSTCFVVRTSAHHTLIAGDTLWGGWHPSIGSDVDAWRLSLTALTLLDIDTLTFGHGPARLLTDATERIIEATERFGFFFDPWHRPSFKSFRW